MSARIASLEFSSRIDASSPVKELLLSNTATHATQLTMPKGCVPCTKCHAKKFTKNLDGGVCRDKAKCDALCFLLAKKKEKDAIAADSSLVMPPEVAAELADIDEQLQVALSEADDDEAP